MTELSEKEKADKFIRMMFFSPRDYSLAQWNEDSGHTPTRRTAWCFRYSDSLSDALYRFLKQYGIGDYTVENDPKKSGLGVVIKPECYTLLQPPTRKYLLGFNWIEKKLLDPFSITMDNWSKQPNGEYKAHVLTTEWNAESALMLDDFMNNVRWNIPYHVVRGSGTGGGFYVFISGKDYEQQMQPAIKDRAEQKKGIETRNRA